MTTGYGKEASAAYDQQLVRTPNRTPTFKSLDSANGIHSVTATIGQL